MNKDLSNVLRSALLASFGGLLGVLLPALGLDCLWRAGKLEQSPKVDHTA